MISLDLDFANPFLFIPSLYKGIAVIRPGSGVNPADLYECMSMFANKLKTSKIKGKLWIVQKHAIREYQEEME